MCKKKITILKTQYDDFRVPGKENTEASAYYTDDKGDALDTARCIHGDKAVFRIRKEAA